MASAAMAKPGAGFYVGADVDKYYSINAFFDNFDEALDHILDNMEATVFVDGDAKAAPFLAALEAEDINTVLKPATKADFENNPYAVVGGEEGQVYNPAEDDELPNPGEIPGELKVESVSAINKQGVTVKFPALTEASTEVTVKVEDDKGNVVEVNPVAVLDVGETVATFTFKAALTADPVGIWKVNGVEFDANAQAAVAAVNAATNQVQLLAALKSTYFTGVVDAYIAQYQEEISGKNFATVEEVQKAIDKVNKDQSGNAAAEAVTKAKNQVELLAALQNGGFERVNADLIAEYANKETTPGTKDYTVADTPSKVQALIDAVNLEAAEDAVDAADTTTATALTADAISKAQKLVTALPEETDGEKATKKGLQDRINVANAFAKVKGATTQASLLSALKAPVLKLQNIDDKLAKYYKDKLVPASITSVAYDIQGEIVDAGNTAAVDDYVAKIGEVKAETTTADLKALLTELKRINATDFTATINDSLLEDYRAAIVTADAADKNTTAKINTIIQDTNANTNELGEVADFDATTQTADELLALLKDKKLALKNVVDANKDAYFADVALIKTEAGKTVEDLQKAINTVNFVANANSASTAAQMQAALTGLAVNASYADYVNLTSAAKLEVAELVLAARAEATGSKFADLEEITTAFETVVDGYTTDLSNVNAATSIAAMKAALDTDTFPKFKALGDLEKVEKAELVLEKLEELKGLEKPTQFKTVAEIMAAAGL